MGYAIFDKDLLLEKLVQDDGDGEVAIFDKDMIMIGLITKEDD